MDDYKIDGQIVCLTSPEFALSYKWYPEAKSFKDNPKIQFISAQSIDKYRNNGYEFDKDIVEGKVLAAHPFKPKTFIEFDTAEHHIYSEKVNAMYELAYRLGAKSIEQKFVLEDIEQLKIDSSCNLSYAKINIDAKSKREEAQKKTSKYHKKQTFEGNYNKDSWEKAKLTAKKYGLDKDAEINNLIITRNPDEKNKSRKILNLTNEGKIIVFKLIKEMYEWEGNFFKDYSPEDFEKFKKMIYDYSQKTIDSLEQFK